jgi:Zn-dependent M28 family amino/carboxypeptidase
MRVSTPSRRILFYGTVLALLGGGTLFATSMPGESFAGKSKMADGGSGIAQELKAHVQFLASQLGERRVGVGSSLADAERYIVSQLRGVSKGKLTLENLGADGSAANNVVFEISGRTEEVVVVGAHYDSAPGTPGANDNASGTAAALVLAKRLAPTRFQRSLRFVLFANEEPPYFQNPGMGSLHHAQGSRKRGDQIVGMLALESLGYYSDEPSSQRYPGIVGWFFPDQGNFLGFVGNLDSRPLVRQTIGAFRSAAELPSEGASLPSWVGGVGWSDHWAFWQHGYQAVMVTDTAVYRDPHYHTPGDLPENLDYARMSLAVLGLQHAIAELAGAR